MFKYWKPTVWLTVLVFLAGTVFYGCGFKTGTESKNREIVKIAIGYQNTTAQTWGAIIIKNQKLYERYLNKRFPDKQFQIEWFNAPSDTPLTDNMISGKIQLAFLGDSPILINGEKGQTLPNYKSVLIAFDGKGSNGKNQAIMIPKGSNLKIQDLKGKTVSTVLGSSAHCMLLAALDKYGLTGKVKIADQNVTEGMAGIQQKTIAANSTWEPYPSMIQFKGQGDVLLNGSDTEVDYLDGVIANRTWAESNQEYVIAFSKALIEAHQFIAQKPQIAAQIFADESGVPFEVCRRILDNVRFDAAIYHQDIKTLKRDRELLQKSGIIKKLDLASFINESYLKTAAEEMRIKYPTEQQLASGWIANQKL